MNIINLTFDLRFLGIYGFRLNALFDRRPSIVSAARSLTCRDDLDSKWRLLLAEKELSRVSLLS